MPGFFVNWNTDFAYFMFATFTLWSIPFLSRPNCLPISRNNSSALVT